MQFPDRTADIEFHKKAARQHRRDGDFTAARSAYFKWAESERQQNLRMGGGRERELKEVQSEYSEFVRTDPLYQKIRDAALPIISDRPGILQTDLYVLLADFDRQAIQYALYFASEHGSIVRTKKGRSYSLNVNPLSD